MKNAKNIRHDRAGTLAPPKTVTVPTETELIDLARRIYNLDERRVVDGSIALSPVEKARMDATICEVDGDDPARLARESSSVYTCGIYLGSIRRRDQRADQMRLDAARDVESEARRASRAREYKRRSDAVAAAGQAFADGRLAAHLDALPDDLRSHVSNAFNRALDRAFGPSTPTSYRPGKK